MSGSDGSPFQITAMDGGFAADTVAATGTVTGALAGASIASIPAANLPAGSYQIQAQLLVTGIFLALDITNMRLQRSASGLVTIVVPGIGLLTTSILPATIILPRVTVNGTDTLSIRATAAATATAVYTAVIMATLLG